MNSCSRPLRSVETTSKKKNIFLNRKQYSPVSNAGSGNVKIKAETSKLSELTQF